ncbi:MAG: ROK family transcriptional regulator [Aestuariivirga sp.]
MKNMALKGTNQEFGRPYNRRIVLETIRQYGPIARGEIAARVGLTVQTVSNITRELEDQDFLLGTRNSKRVRGYPATSLSINPDGGYAIGLNITPIGIEAALVNLAGEIVASRSRGRNCLKPERAFREIATMIADFKALKPGKRLLGVGLAMPGPYDVESMSFVGPTTLEGWKDIPITERLAEIADCPVFGEVDHAAAALGEKLYGAGKDHKDYYYMFFSMGLGGCMVHDGLPIRGSYNNAGEIGHVPVVPDGVPCPCGNRGCLERYVSVEAFERRSAEIGVEGWLKEAAPLFRSAIATIENLFDPQTIIIGGLSETDIPQRLLALAEPLANSVSSRKNRTVPRIIFSTAGRDAALRGAASLAISGALTPRFGMMFNNDEADKPRDPLFNRGAAA